jgi:hypothetical protein
MNPKYMACGHVASATDTFGNPICGIDYGIDPRAEIIATHVNIVDRFARCPCGKVEKSSWDLAFFEYRGEGSPFARDICLNCKYARIAHIKDQTHKCSDRCRHCNSFTEIGGHEFDSYYCGHAGWD